MSDLTMMVSGLGLKLNGILAPIQMEDARQGIATHEIVQTGHGCSPVECYVPHDDGARAERGGGSGRGAGVLHRGRRGRLGAPLRRRRVHPHDLPAVAVEVVETA